MNTTATEGQTLLKVPEAAARLGVSRATVYRLIHAGEISTVTVKTTRTEVGPGSARVPSSAIDAYINRHNKTAVSA